MDLIHSHSGSCRRCHWRYAVYCTLYSSGSVLYDRCRQRGRWREVGHHGLQRLGQEEGWRSQEGHPGQQVGPQGPPRPLLSHPQQPHPHGRPGPRRMEISCLPACIPLAGVYIWVKSNCLNVDNVCVVLQFTSFKATVGNLLPLFFCHISLYIPKPINESNALTLIEKSSIFGCHRPVI